jgi:hypothetical protein
MTTTINGTNGIDKVAPGAVERGEATQQEWLDKVAEIQQRFPYEVTA